MDVGKDLNPKAVALLGAVTGPPGGSVGWGCLWQGTCWPGLLSLTWEWDGAQSGAPRLLQLCCQQHHGRVENESWETAEGDTGTASKPVYFNPASQETLIVDYCFGLHLAFLQHFFFLSHV